MNEGDESLYGIVAKELSAHRRSEALWTKAFALANGEEAATRATYIRLRVEQLKTLRQSSASPKVPAPARAVGAAIGEGVARAKAAELAQVAAHPSATTASLDDMDLYRAAIGPKNQAFYLDYFARADAAGKMLPSWNWPAFLSGGVWVLYRKMYLWFFAFWGVAILSGIFERAGAPWLSLMVAVGAWIPLALYANSLYHNNVMRRISVSNKSISDQLLLLDYLRSRGGVHRWVPWVFGSIPVIGILAAIAVPAYQDNVQRAERSASPPAQGNPFDKFDDPNFGKFIPDTPPPDTNRFVPDAPPRATNQAAPSYGAAPILHKCRDTKGNVLYTSQASDCVAESEPKRETKPRSTTPRSEQANQIRAAETLQKAHKQANEVLRDVPRF